MRKFFTNYKHLTAAVFFLLCAVNQLSAQFLLGPSVGNYSGTNGLYLNPGNIADNRFGVYVNLLSFNTGFYNDYIYYKSGGAATKTLVGEAITAMRAEPGDPVRVSDINFQENVNGFKKSATLYLQARGPAAMVAVHRKHSIGFSTRVRTSISFFDMDEPIARTLRWGLNDSVPAYDVSGDENALRYNVKYVSNNFNFNVNAFSEVAFNYGAVVFEKDLHFVKAGLTYKRLTGIYSAFVKNDGLGGFTIDSLNTITFENTNLSYGYVNEGYYSDVRSAGDFFRKKALGKGNGFDLGGVYEYRTGHENSDDRSVNKYLFKVGVSVIDIGGITYKSSGSDVNTYVLQKNRTVTWASLDSTKDAIEQYDPPDGGSQLLRLDTAIGRVFGYSDRGHEFRMKLPTMLSINFDWKVVEKVYVNVNWNQSLRKKGIAGARYPSALAISPRYERKRVEVGMPLQVFNDYTNFDIGIYARYGPVFLGSDNLSAVFKKNKVFGADLYFGISVPLLKRKPVDTDQDGIPDKKDACPNAAGLEEFEGCPDKDGDGIPDAKDLCPDKAGTKEMKGCPDADGDGIEDRFDKCPSNAGPAETGGCPDTDKDGIIDKDDSCPELAGLAKFAGCPDTDKDGIEDRRDECPSDSGSLALKGCPDKDGDGIANKTDKCPDVAGPAIFNGCPDTDNDSVPDYSDLCPLEKGLRENNGCPKVEQPIDIVVLPADEEEILKEVFDALEFATGKAVISDVSFASLDELVKLLNKRPEYKLYIAGHTDNVGNAKANLKLSQDRALAVKKYLETAGIDSARITTEGFGSKRPVADNATEAGRQKNRRVEFKVIR